MVRRTCKSGARFATGNDLPGTVVAISFFLSCILLKSLFDSGNNDNETQKWITESELRA